MTDWRERLREAAEECEEEATGRVYQGQCLLPEEPEDAERCRLEGARFALAARVLRRLADDVSLERAAQRASDAEAITPGEWHATFRAALCEEDAPHAD